MQQSTFHEATRVCPVMSPVKNVGISAPVPINVVKKVAKGCGGLDENGSLGDGPSYLPSLSSSVNRGRVCRMSASPGRSFPL